MTWFLKLYPPRWRRRYGAELADLVATQPFSMGAAIDLVAGAIDAWLNPQLAPPTADTKGNIMSIARVMQFKCAGYGPTVTKEDKARNVRVNVGGTLVLAAMYLAMVWIWKRNQLTGDDYLLSLAPMTYLIPYLVGLRYTSLKGRSSRAQTIFIVGFSFVLTVFMLAVAWVATKI
jgi:hypothetical protein